MADNEKQSLRARLALEARKLADECEGPRWPKLGGKAFTYCALEIVLTRAGLTRDLYPSEVLDEPIGGTVYLASQGVYLANDDAEPGLPRARAVVAPLRRLAEVLDATHG